MYRNETKVIATNRFSMFFLPTTTVANCPLSLQNETR